MLFQYIGGQCVLKDSLGFQVQIAINYVDMHKINTSNQITAN